MKQSMYKFSDAEFLTAKEKELILRSWILFLSSGLAETKFTKRLYEHLHLHCGFIAHYNINGFYNTYFNGDYVDAKRFFNHFEGDGYKYTSDYDDINYAMAKEYQLRQNKIFSEAQSKNDDRFELLKEYIKRSENDVEFRNQLLNKLYA